MLYTSLITLLSLTQAVLGDSAFFMDTNNILAVETLDPIVNPNAYSGHSHRILGGSGFAASYDRDVYANSRCSSLGPQADKSNYWIPQLYWMDDINGPYTQLPSFHRVYYFNRGTGGGAAVPFPKGMRILNGSPNNKSPTSLHSWTCHTPTGDILRSDFNFDNECVYGVATTVYFPSCWNGVDLYSEDGSHVAHPSGSYCPASHPIRIPQIQLEYQFPPARLRPGVKMAGHLILSNGDTTGYGMHADFVEGWDQNVLAAAMKDPRCNVGEAISATACPPLAATINTGISNGCTPDKGILQEPEGNADWTVFTKLPGCNAPWPSGPKPPCDATFKPLDVSKFTGIDGSLKAADYGQQMTPNRTETAGWRELFCVRNNPGLTGGGSYIDNSLTRASCQTQCLKQGLLYAATGQSGSSWTCTCGSAFDTSSQLGTGLCSKSCPGNTTEKCGDTWIFQTYYAGNDTFFNSSSLATKDGSLGLGCYSPTGTNHLLSKATYSYSSNAMTNDVCIAACKGKNASWAATQNGDTCRCGPTLDYGSGSLVPFSQCTLPCKGNSSQICGDTQRATLYDIRNSKAGSNSTTRPAGYLGCHVDTDGTTANKMPYSFFSETLTPQICINGCNELGYKFAGLIDGKTCFCSPTNPNTMDLPESSCSTKCTGNDQVNCGGNRAIGLFDVSSATVSKASLQNARPAPYSGCFVHSSNAPALSDYSYQTNALSVNTCIQACKEFGYPFAGLSNGNICACGKSVPKTKQMPTIDFCQKPCGGNSKQTCGGFGFMEAFSTTAGSDYSAPSNSTNTTSTGSQGCFADSSSARVLNDYQFSGSLVSVTNCRSSCAEMGFAFAGVEQGNQCYCAKSFSATGKTVLPSSSCSVACAANSAQKCGGSGSIEVFSTSGFFNLGQMPAGFRGCYSDNGSSRTLVGFSYSNGGMTSAICAAACKAQKFSIAGTENGNECWCSNAIASTGTRRPYIECAKPCAGLASEYCGGSSRLSIYNVANATVSTGPAPGNSTENDDPSSGPSVADGLVGCFDDFGSVKPYSYISDFMSPDICVRQCLARGIAYAGVNNGNQCVCSPNRPVRLSPMSSCSFVCTGDATKTCGGSYKAQVYDISKTGISSPAWVLTPDSTGFVGCFQDVNTARILGNPIFTSNAMTNDMCVSNCKSLNFQYAAMQGGNACYCGNAPDPKANGAFMVAAKQCSTPCTGNAKQMCGAGGKSSMFDTKVFKSSVAAPAPVEGSKGCFTTNQFIAKALFTYSQGTMTTELCRRTCRVRGYSLAGLTNANTCGCANDQSQLGAAAVPALCNAACAGDNKQICGGGFSAYVSLFDTTGAGSLAPSSNKEYLGCWLDPDYTKNPVLNSFFISDRAMTTAMCRGLCVGRGSKYYGTEDGNRCYCGGTLPTTGLLPESQCGTNCVGNAAEKCGGGSRISIYTGSGSSGTMRIAGFPDVGSDLNTTITNANSSSSTTRPASASSSNASSSRSASITSSGFNSSLSSTRTVLPSSSNNGSMSRSSSLSVSTSSITSSSARSNVTSSTSGSGSASRSGVSASGSTSSLSRSISSNASVSATSARSSASVSSGSISASSRTSSSISGSLSASSSSSSSSARSSSVSTSTSVSQSSSASSLLSSSRPASSSSSAATSSSSSRATTVSSSQAPSTSSISSSSVKPSSTSSALNAAMSAPSADKSYLGCYTLPPRFIWAMPVNATTMAPTKFTPDSCRAWCKEKKYTFAGMNNGTECGCANDVTTLIPSARDCTIPCAGNTTLMCGGTAGWGVNQVEVSVQRRHMRDFRSAI